MNARAAPPPEPATQSPTQEDPRTQAALDVIRILASDIGPRRPCSAAEAAAGRALVTWLGDRGVPARLDHFRSFPSFAHPTGLILGMGLAGGVLQRRRPRTGETLILAAMTAMGLEGDLRVSPVSALLSRQASANVVASVAPAGETRLRVCLCGHMDTSRSGLMFHPRLLPYLRALIQVPMVSAALLAARPLLRRSKAARLVNRAGLAGIVFGLGMLAERELRGEDVPGASDNASGCGVAAQLLTECAARPLEHTRVDLLITGSEEVGLRGAQAYLAHAPERVDGTIFVNFDTVGGDVPLTYLRREGFPLSRPASAGLIALARQIAERRPDLELAGADRNAGLPTDATVALARGHEALTFLAQGDTIPNYHWPTDTFENIAPQTVWRALEAGRELLAELDREAASVEASAAPSPPHD